MYACAPLQRGGTSGKFKTLSLVAGGKLELSIKDVHRRWLTLSGIQVRYLKQALHMHVHALPATLLIGPRYGMEGGVVYFTYYGVSHEVLYSV